MKRRPQARHGLPVFLAISLLPLHLFAAERVAVIVTAPNPVDAALADNLTEVTMARVAQRGHQVAGAEEFRARLGAGAREVERCAEDATCLGRAAVSLGVTKILIGAVRSRQGQYLFDLALHDPRSGTAENRTFRMIDGPLPQLITTVQDAADAVFKTKLEVGRLYVDSQPPGARVLIDNAFVGVTPMLAGSLLPGTHRVVVEREDRFPWSADVEVPSGGQLEVRLTPDNLPERWRWPAYVAYGSAAAASLSLIGGTFLGVASEINPSLDTRREVMRDFERRRTMGRAANVLLATSVLLAGVSVYHFIKYRDHVFGR